MQLIPVTADDAPLYSALRNDDDTYRWFLSEKKYSPDEVRAWIEDSIRKGDINLFGFVDNVLIGAVSLYKILHEPYGQAELGRVMVAKSQRGKGYGKRLIREASQIAREKGIETIVAFIKESNTASKKAFESVGYRDTLSGHNGVLEYLAPSNLV